MCELLNHDCSTNGHELVHNLAGYVCLWCGVSAYKVRKAKASREPNPNPTTPRRSNPVTRQFLSKHARAY